MPERVLSCTTDESSRATAFKPGMPEVTRPQVVVCGDDEVGGGAADGAHGRVAADAAVGADTRSYGGAGDWGSDEIDAVDSGAVGADRTRG